MFADLDETIRDLLVAEIPIKNGEIEVSFDQPKREWSTALGGPTINLFLYNVRENVTLRNHQWQQLANDRPGDHRAYLRRTPFRVDCFYMLTTWGKETADEHRLLTRTMMVLFRFPVLPEDRLVGSLRNPPFEIETRLATPEFLTDPAELWSALDNEIRPSVPYIVTLALDPWTTVEEPVAQTFNFRVGPTNGSPQDHALAPEKERRDMIVIGGTVRSKAKGTKLAGINVAIKGTGRVIKTDEQGRFKFGGLASGKYTLVIWPAEGKPTEKKITIPGSPGEYDLELEEG